MNIYELFDIDFSQKELICFVGGGGKTTTLFKLAHELKSLGKKVLVTTSTAIFYPDEDDYDKLLINHSVEVLRNIEEIKKGTITIIGRAVSRENKLLGLEQEIIEAIHNKQLFDYILVEADGAKRKPIKSPADHEPVIPHNTDKTVGVIGLDAVGNEINEENVHRPELFCQITNSKMDEVITAETILKLITHEQGLFKDVPEGCCKYVLLNKVENEVREKSALSIKNLVIKDEFNVMGIIATSMVDGKILFKWRDDQ